MSNQAGSEKKQDYKNLRDDPEVEATLREFNNLVLDYLKEIKQTNPSLAQKYSAIVLEKPHDS